MSTLLSAFLSHNLLLFSRHAPAYSPRLHFLHLTSSPPFSSSSFYSFSASPFLTHSSASQFLLSLYWSHLYSFPPSHVLLLFSLSFSRQQPFLPFPSFPSLPVSHFIILFSSLFYQSPALLIFTSYIHHGYINFEVKQVIK